MNLYRDRKDTAATFFILGLLSGLIMGFAACTPPPEIIDSRTGICVANCP